MADLERLRYDEKECFWINDMTPRMLMHPFAKPLLEKPTLAEVADPNGKHLFVEIVDVVKANGTGFVDYLWPQPGAEQPVPKISYVKGYAPWGWIIGSGIYVDDVNKIFMEQMLTQGGIIVGIMLLTALISFVIARSISGPLARTTANMMRLADGDKTITIEGTENKDLWRAAAVGDVAGVKAALAAGADIEGIDFSENKNGRRALNYAALNNRAEVIEVLLAAGANIESQNRTRFTPLHHAAEAGAIDAIEVLLKHGADKRAKMYRGGIPQQIAEFKGHRDAALLLVP